MIYYIPLILYINFDIYIYIYVVVPVPRWFCVFWAMPKSIEAEWRKWKRVEVVLRFSRNRKWLQKFGICNETTISFIWIGVGLVEFQRASRERVRAQRMRRIGSQNLQTRVSVTRLTWGDRQFWENYRERKKLMKSGGTRSDQKFSFLLHFGQ